MVARRRQRGGFGAALPDGGLAGAHPGAVNQRPSIVMKIPENGKLLRVFIGESDRWKHQPLFEAIVLKARELGLAGATVLRGAMGYGANSHLHTTKILRLSMDLPIVIEIIDSEEKIALLLPHLDEMVLEGLVTLEDVRVIKYRANKAKEQ